MNWQISKNTNTLASLITRFLDSEFSSLPLSLLDKVYIFTRFSDI